MIEKTKMTSVDLGMFGLDCFVTDKSSSSLDSDLCIEEFESLLQDSPISSQNILDMSLQQSGIADIETNNNNIGEQMEVGGSHTLILFQSKYIIHKTRRGRKSHPTSCTLCAEHLYIILPPCVHVSLFIYFFKCQKITFWVLAPALSSALG